MSSSVPRGWSASWQRPSTRELAGLATILLVAGVVAARLVAAGAPLGHDEAVYALKSRQMHLGGSSSWYWNDYRAPGLPLMLQLTWLVRGSEPFLRMSVWVFGSLGVILTWAFGRTLFDVRSGLLGAAGLSLASPWLASSTNIWPDVPGAVLGMTAIGILLAATSRERMSWWVLAAAPVTLLAVLTRYGAWLPIGVGFVSVLIWQRSTIRRSLLQLAVLGSIIVGGSFLILAVPGVVGTTTSPLSSIRLLRGSSGFPITQGIRDYLRQADFIAGGYVGLLLLIGLGLAVLYAVKEEHFRPRIVFLYALAGGTAIGIAIVLHGEYRYLAPVYPFAWVIAGMGLAEASRRIGRDTLVVLTGVLAVLVPLNVLSHSDLEVDKLNDRFGDIRVVANAIGDEHGYEDCAVIGSYIPQVGWYSQCVVGRFEQTATFTSPFFESAEYLVYVTGGKRQPEPEVLDQYLDGTDGVFVESGNPNGGNLEYAVAYRVNNDG